MQQPFEQYRPVAHVPSEAHGSIPVGHVFVPLQLVGSELGSWPGQSTHVAPPQSPPLHIVFFVQRLHAAGSWRFVESQFGDTAGLMSTS